MHWNVRSTDACRDHNAGRVYATVMQGWGWKFGSATCTTNEGDGIARQHTETGVRTGVCRKTCNQDKY